MVGSTEKKVGLFIAGGFVLLGVLTILVEDFRLIPNTYELIAYFPSVEGLQKSDPVTLGGVEVGKVAAMRVAEGQIELRLLIENDVVVREDSVASIRMTSLFGGKNVALTIGSDTAAPLDDGDTVETGPGIGLESIMEQADEAIADIRNLINSFNENQDKVLDKIHTMLDKNEEDINETVLAFRDAAQTIQDTGPKLDKLIDSANAIVQRVEAGEGTVGKLLASEELYDDAREFVASLKDAGAAAERLFSDNEPDLREAIASLREAGISLNDTLDRVSRIAKKIDEGEGTLGKMVNDPELYDDARRALDRVNEAAEGVREQTPMTGFLSVLFSAFGR